ncbi:hypothetical protein EXIGLDRAFT_729631 [Exidia glandulosa HHB12029]|uniref:N-acetyltransferase domain-containing protein n=1 Tax=Exidia glandulosa HHB12029 TaxID=1314781 RepID=A0A165LH55_EXIGL|nr:hypothetical protein EXIGLDRAFT_729631 [Exidia glandulosa HHB12029]
MSAYGAIVRANAPTAQLPPLSYPLKADPSLSLSIHHVTLAQTPPEVLQLLHVAFNEELERGRTYPQEGPMDLATYSAYFFAADVFIGVLVPAAAASAVHTLVEAQAGRPWSDCLAGAYYVKPNYPGRSAHACNGGFFVLPAARGKGCGSLLGQSYVINAPLLGYKASVFNLVYCSNEASVRLWDSLGFQKIGRIPRVGRLKKLDGTGDEYVDAWVVWKEFETTSAE